HRAALQLPEDLEQLVGGALLEFPADEVRGLAHDPLAEPPGRPSGDAERERGQLGGPGDRRPGKIRHAPSKSLPTASRPPGGVTPPAVRARPLSCVPARPPRGVPPYLSVLLHTHIRDGPAPGGTASAGPVRTPPSGSRHSTGRGRPGRRAHGPRPGRPPWSPGPGRRHRRRAGRRSA